MAATAINGEAPSTTGPGWVNQSVERIRGLFPLAVERYLISTVGDFVPSATTVTTVARSYALHGLVMDAATARGLSEDETRVLLRRAEVVMSLASIAHESASDHPKWMPAPHGRDRLRRCLEEGEGTVSVDAAAGDGPDRYSEAEWGFLDPYVGAELRLQILGDPWTEPGPGYAPAVRRSLVDVLTLADTSARLSIEGLKDFKHLCICQTSRSRDGEWLAKRLSGDSSKPGTVAGTIAGTMSLLAAVVDAYQVGDEDDVAEVLRYTDLGRLVRQEQLSFAERWSGIALRQEAVRAWREVWGFLGETALDQGGFAPVSDLQDTLAECAPAGTVDAFLANLPATMGRRRPNAAERETEDAYDYPLAALAKVLLSGQRAAELSGERSWGYLGEPGDPDRTQQLSPLWVLALRARAGHRSLRDLCVEVVNILLDRSQRVALDKAGFRGDRYVLPARVIVRDGFVEWGDNQAAGAPPLRLGQLLNLGRQVALFDLDVDGNLKLGRRGGLIDH